MKHNANQFGDWNSLFPNWSWPIRVSDRLYPWLQSGPQDEAELHFARHIDSAPKWELHVHVEAAVAAQFYTDLNEKKKILPEGQEPTKRPQFSTFVDFIKAWLDHTRLITEPDDYFQMGRSFVQERINQRILYTEAHTSVVDTSIMRKRRPELGTPLPIKESLLALCEGLQAGLNQHPGTEVLLIVDCLWLTTLEEKHELIDAMEIILKLNRSRFPEGESLLLGLGMGGPEITANAINCREALERARSLGLLIDLHSGETASMREAISAREHLQPDRIAHGISGSPEFFFEGHTAACPISNLLTGVFSGPLNEHPIKIMHQRGLQFSVNSDDPLLFATTLTLEFVALRRAFGWDVGFFEDRQRYTAEAKGRNLLKQSHQSKF